MTILDRIREPALRGLFQYWDARRGTRRMPGRSDLDPVEMAPFLPCVVLLDVENNPRRFFIRVWGTAVTDGYGEDLTGRHHDELTTGRHNIDPDTTLAETMRTISPSHFELEFETSGSLIQHMERIVLPLSTDGREIDKLLCGVAYGFSGSKSRPAAQ